MLTYTANDLWTLRHAKPPTRAVRKAILTHTCGNRGEPENQLIGQFRLSAERIMHDDICVWGG